MPNTFTEQTLRSTYKDDYHDSDNYHRILFNAGRALQARELTQMQTIIQSEITRFANNVYGKDGVAVVQGGLSVNDAHPYIKISNDQNNSFTNVAALKGQILTGSVSSIKVRVLEAIAATGSDPDTIYVQYLDNPTTVSSTTVQESTPTVVSNEILSNGSNVNLTVSNISTNIGFGSKVEVGESQFYVGGHFVFVPHQQLFMSKYTTGETLDIGFKVVQDIVTVSDTDALYDNQNATPNRASPGADRLRIRLILASRDDVNIGDTFVFYGRIIDGKEYISTKVESQNFDYVNKRIKEINGDFIKQYWKLRVRPDGESIANNFILNVDPGVAYLDGKRIATNIPQQILLPRATDTIVRDDEQVGITYGNYYHFDSGVGMLNIETAEPVTLHTGYGGTGTNIGTANVRAITEGSTQTLAGGQQYQRVPSYKAHLFNVKLTNLDFSLADALSVKSSTDAHLVNLVPRIGNKGTLLVDQREDALIFDTPLPRPKGFAQELPARPATITLMQKFNFTASGTTHEITLGDAGESFVNQTDILIAQGDGASSFMKSGVSTVIGGTGNKKITCSGLTSGKSYEVIGQVKKTNSSVKTKELTDAVVTAQLDSDGYGIQYIDLGKSDVYSVDRIRNADSNGYDLFPYFVFQPNNEPSHQSDSKLIYTGGGLTSATQNVFVRMKYFAPSSNGEFFAVNSYDGQLDYLDIPAQSLPDGGKVSLRDVIDLRPSTNGAGAFTSVPSLPIPSDTITADAEYYLPRNDKLVISKNSELRLVKGSSSLNPKFPEVPEDCMDLYNIRMNPNTLHTQDMKSTLIPRKGYTMQDINKLEEKIDKLQEMTSLSLLELNTKIGSVLDSAGNDRAKSGFFVDNFANHAHTHTRSKEGAKSAIDKVAKMLRPRAPEEESSLFYDSDVTGNLRVQLHGDMMMLDHTEVPYDAQELASSTENLLPFHVPFTIGRLTISPETDTWKETQKVGESVVGNSTEFDLREALNWNNSNNAWFGVDPSSLDVGETAKSFVSGTSTTVVQNTQDPVLVGTSTQEELGEWVKTGTVTNNTTLSTETVEVNRERQEEVSRSAIDAQATRVSWAAANILGSNFIGGGSIWAGGNFGLAGSGGGTFRNQGWRGLGIRVGENVTTDNWDTVTTETRSKIRSTNTSTFETTKTITEENRFEQTTETTTTTSTSNTVNRVASESSIRDIVGKRVIDVSVIPFMRSVEIRFKAEGLRPNTQYFPFFDNTNVSQFCRTESSFKFSNRRRWLNTRLGGGIKDNHFIFKTSQVHNKGKTNLTSDAEGTVIGSFVVPNNASMRFHTGKREFMLIDVNTANEDGAMSFAKTLFQSAGTLEKFEHNIHVTRTLKITGTSDVSVEQNTTADSTVWTDTVVTTEPAVDIKSSSTVTAVTGNRETTRENESTTTEFVPRPRITPVPPATTPTVPPAATRPTTPTLVRIPVQERRGRGRRRGRRFRDPIAQTFQVLEAGGLFITSMEVYFATKSNTAPVFCELRPTVNGVPHSDVILASKKLSPAQVTTVTTGSNNKAMLSQSTKFTFDTPVFCPVGDYALVLVPGDNSPDYNAYAAKVGEFQLGSQEARVTQQATLGAFFKSQNGKTWEAASGSDLTYKVNVANFVSSGNIILQNANVDPEALSRDPLVVDSGSNTVRVAFANHGLRTGDRTIIRGIDSATSFGNGLTGANVNGLRTVVAYDNSGYTYTAGASATSRMWFGGSSVTSSQNLNFEVLRPSIDITQPSQTNVTLSMKTTSQQSLAGDQTRFSKESKFQIVENEKNIYYSTPRAVYNRSTENLSTAGKMNGARSLEMQITLKSTSPFLSPIVDLERAKVMTMHNLISKQDSSATQGFNVPLTYISETHPMFGSESAKHVTKITTLTEEAVGLKILVAANRPPESDFQVYWRCGDAGVNLEQNVWTLVNPDNTLPPDTNKNTFREYRYLVGGEGGALPPFTKFQTKIVMRSTNSAQVPTFRDLRVIALAV